MSKNYKRRTEQTKTITVEEEKLSKKEQYDLEKQKKQALKEKQTKKNAKKKKNSKKTYQTNLSGRIFAVIMLILMIGSVVASIAAYIR